MYLKTLSFLHDNNNDGVIIIHDILIMSYDHSPWFLTIVKK